MCHSAGNARIGARDLVIAGVAVLFLSGCTHDLAQATDVPDRFPGYPEGTRAGQLPDPTLKSYFLTVFGRSERVTACACERSGEVTLPQVLHLQNGETIVQKIASTQGRLARLMKEKKSEEQLAVMMRPGHYYQVIPIRRVRVEDMRFELAEITKDKSQSIGGENSRV